jgi:hypothetical protein
MLKSIPSTFTLQRTDRKGGIEQSQALPVRLVPYATGDIVSTVGLVQMLAKPDSPLSAYVVPNDKSPPHALPPMHWKMLEKRIPESNVSSDIDLPAGVFVWLDGLDYVYDFYFTPDRREPGWTSGERELMTIRKEVWVDETTVPALLEGFEIFFDNLAPTQPPASEKHQPQKQQVSQPGTQKRWTDELKQELADYREKHGTKKAAEHFGISAQRIRHLLPGEKAKSASFFPMPKR